LKLHARVAPDADMPAEVRAILKQLQSRG